MFYSEDIIEQVRSENNIVDVIVIMLSYRRREVHILDLSFPQRKNHLHFPCHHTSRCITVLDVEKGEMLYLSYEI